MRQDHRSLQSIIMEKIRITGSRSRLRKCDSLISETRLDSSKVFSSGEQNWKEGAKSALSENRIRRNLPGNFEISRGITAEGFRQRARSLHRMMYLLLCRSTDSAPTFPKSSRPERFSRSNVSRGSGARREIEFSISSGKGPASRFRRVSCPWVVGRLVR